MGNRELVLRQNLAIFRSPCRGKWIKALVIAVAVGAREAWDYGIITAAAHIAWLVAVGIWRMLYFIASTLWDFLCVLFHRQS